MNIFDIIFLIIIGILFIYGMINGFLREFFTTAGLIAGYIFASRFYEKYSEYVNEYLLLSFFGQYHRQGSLLITYLSFILMGLFVGIVLGGLIGLLTNYGLPSLGGRFLGAISGTLKGVVVCLVIFTVFSVFIEGTFGDELRDSFAANYLLEILVILKPLLKA